MKIQVTREKHAYRAVALDLSGTHPCGSGSTQDEAIGNLVRAIAAEHGDEEWSTIAVEPMKGEPEQDAERTQPEPTLDERIAVIAERLLFATGGGVAAGNPHLTEAAKAEAYPEERKEMACIIREIAELASDLPLPGCVPCDESGNPLPEPNTQPCGQCINWSPDGDRDPEWYGQCDRGERCHDNVESDCQNFTQKPVVNPQRPEPVAVEDITLGWYFTVMQTTGETGYHRNHHTFAKVDDDTDPCGGKEYFRQFKWYHAPSPEELMAMCQSDDSSREQSEPATKDRGSPNPNWSMAVESLARSANLPDVQFVEQVIGELLPKNISRDEQQRYIADHNMHFEISPDYNTRAIVKDGREVGFFTTRPEGVSWTRIYGVGV